MSVDEPSSSLGRGGWRPIVFRNGHVALAPLLLWNLLLYEALPSAFSPERFNEGIPSWLLLGENVARAAVFILPTFIQLQLRDAEQKTGAALFGLGVALYFASWLALILAPQSGWSRGAPGLLAPAYTPALWLLGLSLMGDRYHFSAGYRWWHMALPSLVFLILHVAHAALALPI